MGVGWAQGERKVKGDRDAWVARNPADEDIVRPIPGGTVIKTRIAKRAADISVPAAIGMRRPCRQSASQSPAG